jgi:tetratricopeptide (TPR) repeat protein
LILGIGGFGAGWHSKGFLGNTSTLAIPVVETSAVQKQHAIRSSVNQVSSSSLLARTFVEEARELIFPSIDRARLGAAEILCQRAIEIAPDLSTGHSCDAFTQAYFAFVTPRSGARDARQLRATKAAATALRIDPADADTQMAHAWTQFVNGDRKAAINRARTALGLAPEEQFLRNFYGMMMVFDGQGPEILLPHSSDANGAQASDRYHLFIMAGAYFQASEYLETIRAIDAAVKDEGRTSALMTAIRIAAYEASGNQSAAERYAANFATSWPERKPEEILSILFSNESDVLAISKRVDSAMARYEVH